MLLTSTDAPDWQPASLVLRYVFCAWLAHLLQVSSWLIRCSLARSLLIRSLTRSLETWSLLDSVAAWFVRFVIRSLLDSFALLYNHSPLDKFAWDLFTSVSFALNSITLRSLMHSWLIHSWHLHSWHTIQVASWVHVGDSYSHSDFDSDMNISHLLWWICLPRTPCMSMVNIEPEEDVLDSASGVSGKRMGVPAHCRACNSLSNWLQKTVIDDG